MLYKTLVVFKTTTRACGALGNFNHECGAPKPTDNHEKTSER